jgi:hypothetical protein
LDLGKSGLPATFSMSLAQNRALLAHSQLVLGQAPYFNENAASSPIAGNVWHSGARDWRGAKRPPQARRRRGLQHYPKEGHLSGPTPCHMVATTRSPVRGRFRAGPAALSQGGAFTGPHAVPHGRDNPLTSSRAVSGGACSIIPRRGIYRAPRRATWSRQPAHQFAGGFGRGEEAGAPESPVRPEGPDAPKSASLIMSGH